MTKDEFAAWSLRLSGKFVTQFLPDDTKGTGEIFGVFGDPGGDSFGGEPVAALDLGRVELEGAIRVTAINPDMLLIGLGTGRQFE
jgi:hypothetical protein